MSRQGPGISVEIETKEAVPVLLTRWRRLKDVW